MSVEIPVIPYSHQLIAVECVHANPWQTRLTDDLEHVNAIAEDICVNGLLQIPVARLHPHDVGLVQLAFGHNRFAAWKVAKPGEPFPVDLRELSDRQMSDMAAVENVQRKNLTPIQTAQAIQKRMYFFDLSQLEAGKPFGYKTQGAVANLLRLLRLPESIQPFVGDGGLPERHARMLVNVARVFPKEAEQVVKLVIASEDKDQTFDHSFEKMLREKGRHMWGAPFDKVVVLSSQHVIKEVQKFLGDFKFLPVCKGCEFFVGFENSEYCMRSACYDLKVKAFAYHEAERLAKKFGIGVLDGEANSSERVGATLVYVGRNRQEEKMALAALQTKHESLRLRPLWAANDHNDYDRERVLGSKFVVLYTTDMTALKKAMAQLPKEKKQEAAVKSMDAGKRKEKEMRDRRDECRRLMLAAAPHFSKVFSMSEVMLDAIIPTMSSHHFAETSSQIELRAKKLDGAGKAQIVAEIVLARCTDAGHLYSGVQPVAAIKKIQTLAASLKVKLPAGWHVVPVKKVRE